MRNSRSATCNSPANENRRAGLRPKLTIILLLIVLLPLGLLAGLGLRVARDEKAIVEHRFRTLLTGKLSDIAARVARLIEEKGREIERLTSAAPLDAESLRRLVRTAPGISQMFVLDPEGRRVFPPPAGPLSAAERDFLQRAGPLWQDKHIFYRTSESGDAETWKSYAGRNSRARAFDTSTGWYVWYWASGANFVFWRRDPAGNVVGVELNRSRLLADVLAELPNADISGPALPDGRVVLLDSKSDPLYQWGAYEPPKGEGPAATLPLGGPLNAWKLEYHVPGAGLDRAFGGGVLFNFTSGLAVVAVALAGLAVYFYRESSRETREATRKVSFVNQVSHELKTPLTNIRMYAELLEQRLEDGDEKTRQQLGVVVSESQRLSRLINNVLTFARQQRKKLNLHLSAASVDDVVRAVLEHFRPSFETKGVEIVFSPGAAGAVKVDTDALGQILGNLFGNVEKYAASGGLLEIETGREGDRTVVTVSDRGPGIPDGLRDKVFEPFCRASDKLTDGAAGTGIGLTIARELARLHGGDLTLSTQTAPGARFRIVLHTPPAQSGEST